MRNRRSARRRHGSRQASPFAAARPVLYLAEPLERRMLLAADLVGTAFDVSPDAIPGVASVPLGDDPTFSVSLTVKNQNIVPFLDDSGNFRVRVYLSPNASISTSDTLLQELFFLG